MKAQAPRNRGRLLPLIIAVTVVFHILIFLGPNGGSVFGVQILSKSKLEKCEKVSESENLNCSKKIILDMAVPSGSSGGEASIVAEIVEVEENSTHKMQTLRLPPRITVNKSAAYAVYEITYIRDVPYKPQEYFVKTRKCEPDASVEVVKICERLQDDNGHTIEHTQPICCPCGTHRRVPSSCGNFFDKLLKGKANTAHCLRFPGDWFHVFGIGQRSLGFNVHIEVKTGSKISEVTVGPENRTAMSSDKFLSVNLIGDFAGYTNIPSFEDFYLVIPRQGGPGQPQALGVNFSMWMLLERVRFTLDGLECNKIGISYEAFNGQPNFCSSPFWSCLHNQLWNFREADQNRINRHQLPLYGVEGRFERINRHPNAGTRSFSIGITEVLNTNLLIELSADDIDYVYQRSPGKITSVTIPTFEALTQFGIATITTKNVGEVEASYSLTFDCSKDVTLMEEQFFIMKPNEIAIRSFKLYPTTDHAAKYVCSAILKDSDYTEVDRAECQFTTTATVLDSGSQTAPSEQPKASINDFFESIASISNKFWDGFIDFITGKTCRFASTWVVILNCNVFVASIVFNKALYFEKSFISSTNLQFVALRKCSGFFDFSCHIQYICMSWIVMFGLLLAIFPTVLVLIWLLHQKGLFDPLYDWWEDRFWADNHSSGGTRGHAIDIHFKHHKQEARHYSHDAKSKQRSIHDKHKHKYSSQDSDYYYYLHHVNKNKHKHRRRKSSSIMHQVYSDIREDDSIRQCRHRKERDKPDRYLKMTKNGKEKHDVFDKHKHGLLSDGHFKLHAKHKE